MDRDILQDLLAWRNRKDRLPLLIRGARQVGKSFVIEQFGKKYFDNILTINFEQQPEYKNCFTTLYPHEILKKIYVLSRQQITPGKTLLFLDEVQECQNVILALRYFYEQKPELHVIAAGSLLEFTLRKEDFRMPVGRIQSLYMYPLSFKEFLSAKKEDPLLDYINNLTFTDSIEPLYHQRLLALLKEYWVIGGMPAAIRTYLNTNDLHECQVVQSGILETYRGDFGKYASRTNIRYLQRLFEKAPGLVAKHFQYVAVDPDMQSRDIKNAVTDLVDAGIIHTVHATTASGLPLISTINEKKFKLLFLDIGLVIKAQNINADVLLQDDLMLVNQGNIAEQFVGQELQAYSTHDEKSHLYYWERTQTTSTAEVDFVATHGTSIYPIEVKAGATGRLRSLQIFLKEKGSKFGVRVSQKPLQYHKGLLSIPLYMLFHLPQFLSQIIASDSA